MKLSNMEFTAFVGLDWADAKHEADLSTSFKLRRFTRYVKSLL